MGYIFYGDSSKLNRDIDCDSPLYSSLLGQAEVVDPCTLIEACEMDGLLDDGESYSDFASSDDSTQCFRSEKNGETVYFIQMCGCEFLFTLDGNRPTECDDRFLRLYHEIGHDPLARTMTNPNSALSNGQYHRENAAESIQSNVDFIDGAIQRFRLYEGEAVIAGLSVIEGVVESMYVTPEYRRNGCATQLFNAADDYLGGLEHSETLTDDGKHFKDSFSLPGITQENEPDRVSKNKKQRNGTLDSMTP